MNGSRNDSMIDIIRATPLYEFLRRCNENPLPRTILDCGAGGNNPTLSLFYQYGYETCGIEIAEVALAEARAFCLEEGMPLNIIPGDMRMIPFTEDSFSFVYAYEAVSFMTKPDIAISIIEMKRVMKPGGLCFVNFISVDDPDRRPFCESAFARRLLKSESFSRFKDNEAEKYFRGFEIVHKQKRLIDKIHGKKRLKQARIDYIAKKT